jgi:hypothetical protein
MEIVLERAIQAGHRRLNGVGQALVSVDCRHRLCAPSRTHIENSAAMTRDDQCCPRHEEKSHLSHRNEYVDGSPMVQAITKEGIEP